MKKAIIGVAILLSCTVVPVAAIFGYEAYRTRDLTAEIVARAPEIGNFHPPTLRLKRGEPAKIRIRNVDTVAHGFAIPALGVDAGRVDAGHVETVEFVPEQEGRFVYLCTVYCGDFHFQMRGTLEVVP